MIVAGTLIATPAGDRPVEALRAGDEVHVLDAGALAAQPLRWVGRLDLDLGKTSPPGRNTPVRLVAGAISEGRPARDLSLSPDHAILIGRVLLQAQALRNDASIAQPNPPGPISYVALELAKHGILLAEALPVESYLDIGNRSQFTLGRAARAAPPDLSQIPAGAALAIWKARGCAPLRLDGAAIVPAHLSALDRARAIGWTVSDDPALTIFADAQPVPTARFGPDHWQARLPPGTRAVTLASRSFCPADLNAGIADRRRLGIAVRAVRLGGSPPPPAAFSRGWHLSEPEWRWSDGDARLTLRPLKAPATLEIRTAPGAVPGYWVAPA